MTTIYSCKIKEKIPRTSTLGSLVMGKMMNTLISIEMTILTKSQASQMLRTSLELLGSPTAPIQCKDDTRKANRNLKPI